MGTFSKQYFNYQEKAKSDYLAFHRLKAKPMDKSYMLDSPSPESGYNDCETSGDDEDPPMEEDITNNFFQSSSPTIPSAEDFFSDEDRSQPAWPNPDPGTDQLDGHETTGESNTPYARTVVFSFHWDLNDLRNALGLYMMSKVLRRHMYFDELTYCMPFVESNENIRNGLEMAVKAFVEEHGTDDRNLLIFLYSGHGGLTEHCEGLHIARTSTSGDVCWSDIQAWIHHNAKADVLFIYDCCNAGAAEATFLNLPARSLNINTPKREIIGAVARHGNTADYPESTLTMRIARQLLNISLGEPTTVDHIVNRLVCDHVRPNEYPFHFALTEEWVRIQPCYGILVNNLRRHSPLHQHERTTVAIISPTRRTALSGNILPDDVTVFSFSQTQVPRTTLWSIRKMYADKTKFPPNRLHLKCGPHYYDDTTKLKDIPREVEGLDSIVMEALLDGTTWRAAIDL